MIAIVDYSMGNVGSIQRMLKKVGADSALTSDPQELRAADKLILPGVGAFDAGMNRLNDSGLTDLLNELELVNPVLQHVQNGRPLLGICLGMQLLLDSSEEGTTDGLGWVPGRVRRFDWPNESRSLKVPHMGWNLVRSSGESPLFRELDDRSRFYFVHSYFASPDEPASRAAEAHYGFDFCCAVQRDNIHGVQFHPEKSHRYGLKLLQNFVEL